MVKHSLSHSLFSCFRLTFIFFFIFFKHPLAWPYAQPTLFLQQCCSQCEFLFFFKSRVVIACQLVCESVIPFKTELNWGAQYTSNALLFSFTSYLLRRMHIHYKVVSGLLLMLSVVRKLFLKEFSVSVKDCRLGHNEYGIALPFLIELFC